MKRKRRKTVGLNLERTPVRRNTVVAVFDRGRVKRKTIAQWEREGYLFAPDVVPGYPGTLRACGGADGWDSRESDKGDGLTIAMLGDLKHQLQKPIRLRTTKATDRKLRRLARKRAVVDVGFKAP